MVKAFSPLFYAARSLSRERVFSLIVILVLTLGIAANTTIYTVIDQIILSSLPYRDPARVVMVWESNPNQPEPAGSHIPAARDNFDSWRKQCRSFEALEGYQQTSYNLTGLRNPEHLDVARTTAGFFRLLGVRPALGRDFTPDDELPGREHVVVLSHTFFTSHFQGGIPMGQTLLLNGVPYTVIGVLPREFHLPNIFRGLFEYKPDVWIPLAALSASDPPEASRRRGLLVYARLANNVSLAQAGAEMTTIAARRAKDDPALDSGYSANVFALDVENTDLSLKRALYLLWIAVALVLLLACINVAGLMLLRNANMKKDIAIMAALGARRGDIIRTVASPGLVLVLLGTLLGIAAACGGIRLVAWADPSDIHAVERLVVDTHALIFAMFAFTIVVGLVAFLPAWLSSRGDLNMALKQGPGMRGTARPRSLNRSVLVSAEVAIALILAIGATLLVRSVQRLLGVNPGFAPQGILTAHLSLPQPRYHSREEQARFCDSLLRGLRSLPQVQEASLIDNLPLYAIHYAPFEIEGRPVLQSGNAPTADYANLTPNFFQTMGISLRRGRLFTEADAQDNAAKVVIVNETLARQLWPSEDPVGSHLRSLSGGAAGPWATVVGVVGDFVQFNVDTPPRPELFWPARELRDMSVVIKTAGNPASLSSAMKQKVWEIDKEQPISDVLTLQELVERRTSQARFNMWVLSVFAGLGVVLALVGVYGLISYLVSSRIRDIGIRMALGAQKKHVFFSLLRQTLPFVGVGIVLGVGFSLLFGSLMSTLLFRITTLDPVTYAIAPMAILSLMLLAVVFPARRATQVDPVSVLRQE
jgi:putative ABC transport system permease protein